MHAALIPFCLLAGLVLASALGILWAKNVLNAALLLILCLLGIAGLYAVLNAEFLAVTQVMVYAGGVLVLILFGIMITVRTTGSVPEVERQNTWVGLFTCTAFFLLLSYCLQDISIHAPFNQGITSTQSLGVKLITGFAAPLELSGVLLLISLIGASLAASYQKHG